MVENTSVVLLTYLIGTTIGVGGGVAGGLQPPPPAFEKFCKFGQIRARFKIFSGKFGQSLGYFWSFVLDFLGNYLFFSGKKGQPPARKWPGTPMIEWIRVSSTDASIVSHSHYRPLHSALSSWWGWTCKDCTLFYMKTISDHLLKSSAR